MTGTPETGCSKDFAACTGMGGWAVAAVAGTPRGYHVGSSGEGWNR
ncbi:hypothetical protein [Umezawaea tangerina]|uniref:Uncharacterized protein n=1 Tax=Umezawaea tangerina TaxID=84725 RepID=A0A2T0SU73_9PSEU|nr:hypothetical protein [Umezawaea tangerina]PRY36962.1 hypothetical protein CLV43_111334 [Umezawaea tangerina]